MPPSTLSQIPAAAPVSPLHLRAYEEIKRLIVSGEFPPDTFLSERQLAARLGMSKTPVHIALKRIETEGFVVISPQQGIVVRGLAPADILDQYELREAIESFVVRKLAGTLDAPRVALLRQSLSEQEAALRGGDFARCLELDAAFHLLLASLLGNGFNSILAILTYFAAVIIGIRPSTTGAIKTFFLIYF